MPVEPGKPLPISLCMIVKNEEKYLEKCLWSVENLVSEMIIVDTGSTDATKQIAGKFGAKIFDFEWIDDFAAARNYSLEQATQPYILQLDADEEILKSQTSWFYEQYPWKHLAYLIEIHNLKDLQKMDLMMSHFLIRFFKNDPEIRYQNKVHENVTLPKVDVGYSSAVIIHKGYADQERKKPKADRNFTLLKKELAKNPRDPFKHYYFAQQYFAGGDLFNAYKAAKKSLILGLRPPVQANAFRIALAWTLEHEDEKEFAEFIEMAPDELVFPERLLYQGMMKLKFHLNEEAESLIDRFIDLAENTDKSKVNRISYDGVLPDNYRIGLETKSKILAARDDYSSAKDILIKALSVAPSAWRLKALVGQYAYKTGKTDEAILWFKDLVKDFKDYPEDESISQLISKYEQVIVKLQEQLQKETP